MSLLPSLLRHVRSRARSQPLRGVTAPRIRAVVDHRICAVARYGSLQAKPLPAATVEGENKRYSPKIVRLVEDIGNLTILEVADLNELLKITLNITDVPMMAAASAAAPVAAAAAAPVEEATEKPREKTIFNVKLVGFDAGKKVALIKEVKNSLEGFNLVQSKKFVESVPQVLKEELPKKEAEALKAAIEACGGQVELE